MGLKIFTKENRSKFIEDNKVFISSTAEYFCNRPLDWLKDDELNIALISFNRACESQSEIYTDFLGFTATLIKSTLIQYYIKLEEPKTFTFFIDNKPYEEYLETLTDFEMYFENKARAIEIALLSDELGKHRISFKNLINIKFEGNGLKNDLLNLALSILKNDELTEKTLSSKRLLLNKNFYLENLSSLTHLEWETVKKYRKYIIMLLLVFSKDEYMYFKAYLNIRVGDSNV